MITAKLKVIEVARPKKSCRCCEKMVQAPAPSRPIPGSMAGGSLLAHVLVSSLTTICRYIGKTRSSRAWVPTSRAAHSQIGVAAHRPDRAPASGGVLRSRI